MAACGSRASGTAGPRRSEVKDQEIRYLPCDTPPCVYHPGSKSHRECLNGDAKRCFLYGKACTPDSTGDLGKGSGK
jgi:hypothetical protein